MIDQQELAQVCSLLPPRRREQDAPPPRWMLVPLPRAVPAAAGGGSVLGAAATWLLHSALQAEPAAPRARDPEPRRPAPEVGEPGDWDLDEVVGSRRFRLGFLLGLLLGRLVPVLSVFSILLVVAVGNVEDIPAKVIAATAAEGVVLSGGFAGRPPGRPSLLALLKRLPPGRELGKEPLVGDLARLGSAVGRRLPV